MSGEVGDELEDWLEGGRVSHERVRRQDCRMIEKDVEERGSWEEV